MKTSLFIILAMFGIAGSLDYQVATMDLPVEWTMNVEQADAGIEHPQDMRYAALPMIAGCR